MGRPTLLDRAFQAAFIVAHRLLRAWWRIRRPHTRGALIAVWHGGEVLVVKNSYRKEFTLPGGYVRPGESVVSAAARELAEECEIEVEPESLRQVYSGVYPFEQREDDVTIVEVTVAKRPIIEVDHREVVWAGFKRRDEVLQMEIVPHLRAYLQNAVPTATA